VTQNKKVIKIKKLLVHVLEQLSDNKVAVVNVCVLVNEFNCASGRLVDPNCR